MYKPLSKEIAFEDFNQPVGMHLSAENRWVEKAKLIDWESIEKAYSCNFHGINGQVAKPARLALGALLIQIEYGYSDLEVVDQIQENPYLQYFCGFPGYIYEKPFHASLMVRFRKRFNPKIMAKINEAFIRKAEVEQYSFEAYNESEYLLQEIEHYRSLYGCYLYYAHF